MKAIKQLFTLLILSFGLSLNAQELKQTIRGTLTDFDTKVPIVGAKIIVLGTDPLQGSITDINGDFKIKDVTVGRADLRMTAIGYQEINIQNALIESGKEKILNLEMTVDIKVLTKVEVSSQKDKSEAINKMALVSAKTFTVEETNRYAGSLNDPARSVSSFAGVVGDAGGNNDIVVRGNSPRGILWRLEGIDIPNPNHFAGQGATGGPVNALNGGILANSDFFSGAFAPEYGNVLSGVFDVKFRQGNNQNREYILSAGVLGLDATLEGPFKKGYRGSYLVNYRYSSIAILDRLGVLDFQGIPIYQDASFKFVFPTKKLGTFSLIGLGGASNIFQTFRDDSTDAVVARGGSLANLGVVGLKHTYIINPKLYIKSYVSASSSSDGGRFETLNNDSTLTVFEDFNFRDSRIKGQTILNYNLNPKNTFQFGATYTYLDYNFRDSIDFEGDGFLTLATESEGNSSFMQSFLSWRYRISNELSIVSGLHYTHFFLNDNFSVEPRVSARWQFKPRHNLSLGVGLHSRLESVSTYLYNTLEDDGTFSFPNRGLDLSKSAHFVIGHSFQLNEHLRLKTETYYQHLYNLPVSPDSASTFALLNTSGGIPGSELINGGTGRNYGLELTLERYFNNSFYFLITGSLYKSEYRALDGVLRNTRFDGSFASNVLIGKEFKFGKNRNKTFGLNSKVSYVGGNRFTPIDLEASQLAGRTIRQADLSFTERYDNVFLFNIGLTYRADMKRASHSFKIDIQNALNSQAVVTDYYDSSTGKVGQGTQLSFVPNLIYTIKF